MMFTWGLAFTALLIVHCVVTVEGYVKRRQIRRAIVQRLRSEWHTYIRCMAAFGETDKDYVKYVRGRAYASKTAYIESLRLLKRID